ncbi:F-type H+-transporting ATPase subunit gamma [Caloramator fervidus]|uniref:ATP synthase gamma chain n=1 Tax=Caloramator fervidus TaxID=29344 RepID=A0A1H5RNI2_9CLOT|nr:ATP synthase F1 subunit gamma [Caloramator fervidus]SEF39077.1 F-type H+-transporting ATPase subunit gamma [Caloramator fervidus]
MSKGELLEIKRRIKSIKNTQKITKAMGLVATARFKRLREIQEYTNEYFKEVSNTLEKLYLEEVFDSVYFKENNSDRDLYIIITSNTGLCGSYNSNIINFAKEKIKKDDYLIVIGDKGYNFFKKRGYEIVLNLPSSKFPSYEDAKNIVNVINEYYLSQRVKNVYLIYTKFISSVKQEVECLKLLPCKKNKTKSDILLEPSKINVFEFCLKIYLEVLLYNSISNSLASEFAIRMSAMDSATRNSQELLDKLQIKFNRIRQSIITQEVTEIVSGAEALNSN